MTRFLINSKRIQSLVVGAMILIFVSEFSFAQTSSEPNAESDGSSLATNLEEVDEGEVPIQRKYENMSGVGVFEKYIKYFGIIRRINSYREDNIIRTLRQQLDTGLKMKITGERKIEESNSMHSFKENRKIQEVVEQTTAWITEYARFREEEVVIESAMNALEKRRATFEALRDYYVAKEANHTTDRPLPQKPTTITKAPIFSGRNIGYSKKDLQEEADIPSIFSNRASVEKQIKREERQLSRLLELRDDRIRQQAILHQRLERLSRKPLFKNPTAYAHLGDVAMDRRTSHISLVDMTDAHSFRDFKLRVARNIDGLLVNPKIQSALYPGDDAIKEVQEARAIDRTFDRLKIKKAANSCRDFLRAVNRGSGKFWKGVQAINDMSEKPGKIGKTILNIAPLLAVVGLTFSVQSTIQSIKNVAKSKEELEQEKKAAEAQKRAEDISHGLQEIIDNVQTIDEFQDQFYKYAVKFWHDKGVGLFYDVVNGIRKDFEELPGDTKPLDGVAAKYEPFMFDHAKEVFEKYSYALDLVAKKLDGRAENMKKKEELKAKTNQGGLERTLPAIKAIQDEEESSKIKESKDELESPKD